MLKSFGLLVLLILTSIYGGWVFQTLYTWFIIPVFHLNSISIGQAIGIQLFAGLFYRVERSKDMPPTEAMQHAILTAVVKFTMLLMFGWFLTLFL